MKESKDAAKMTDTIIHIGNGSVIQHGKQNDRCYLMKLAGGDTGLAIQELTRLAAEYGYSKLFCKIPQKEAPLFFAEGFSLEGYIPNFYKQKEDAFFVSKFINSRRLITTTPEPLKEFYKLLQVETLKASLRSSAEYTIRPLIKSDIPAMVEIYTDIFETYPFPIHDPVYIEKCMLGDIQFFGAFKEGKLIALASAEIDFEAKNAEMTDFATHRAHTGHNLASLILDTMEKRMRQQGIMTLYTIARLHSIPMNKTFLRAGYTYSGTLINNTQISGQIESMNLYYKL